MYPKLQLFYNSMIHTDTMGIHALATCCSVESTEHFFLLTVSMQQPQHPRSFPYQVLPYQTNPLSRLCIPCHTNHITQFVQTTQVHSIMGLWVPISARQAQVCQLLQLAYGRQYANLLDAIQARGLQLSECGSNFSGRDCVLYPHTKKST